MYNRHWKRDTLCVKKENPMSAHMRVAHKHQQRPTRIFRNNTTNNNNKTLPTKTTDDCFYTQAICARWTRSTRRTKRTIRMKKQVNQKISKIVRKATEKEKKEQSKRKREREKWKQTNKQRPERKVKESSETQRAPNKNAEKNYYVIKRQRKTHEHCMMKQIEHKNDIVHAVQSRKALANQS